MGQPLRNTEFRWFLFRRHCITATVIQLYDIVLFLDADIGVVNPNQKIENFLEDSVDLVFYDRFQNWEIATGSYLARNTKFAVDFLREFANYESKLPNGTIHGSDNGAIHVSLQNFKKRPIPTARNQWFSPFSGEFHVEKCTESNSTWNYDIKLIGDVEEIQKSLRKMADDVEVMKKGEN
ncbi:unnamed protein product [Caenorhabditis nigoni]